MIRKLMNRGKVRMGKMRQPSNVLVKSLFKEGMNSHVTIIVSVSVLTGIKTFRFYM